MPSDLTAEQIGELEATVLRICGDNRASLSLGRELYGTPDEEAYGDHQIVFQWEDTEPMVLMSIPDSHDNAAEIASALLVLLENAPALIAAAKRVEVAERQKRIACGVADKLGERLRASNARATAAEARVGELEDVRKHAEQLVYIISQWRNGGLRIGACKQAEDKLIEAIARTALKPQEPRP